jgi:hypothetical protein
MPPPAALVELECPLCLWDRTAAGRDALLAATTAYRAHLEIAHLLEPAVGPPPCRRIPRRVSGRATRAPARGFAQG